MDGTILVADDDRSIRDVITRALTRAGCRVHGTSSLRTLMGWVDEGRGDVVITDVVMPDGDGIDLLPQIRKCRPQLPVIVISAKNSVVTAIRASKAEVDEYLPKPFNLADLMRCTGRALARQGTSGAPARETILEDADLPLVGRSSSMQVLYRQIARALRSRVSALVLGESGTGKSLIAQLLHDHSCAPRAPRIVVTGSSPAISSDVVDRLGQAPGGSIIIDRADDLSAAGQETVLRLVEAVDGDGTTPGQGVARILATATRDLTEMAASGAMRTDLAFRLSSLCIQVPPLRQRRDDIGLLFAHFNASLPDGLVRRHLGPAAAAGLGAHTWPGNLHELQNVVLRLASAGTGEVSIQDIQDLLAVQTAPLHMATDSKPAGPAGSSRPDASGTGACLRDAVIPHLKHLIAHQQKAEINDLHRRVVREIERPLLQLVLAETGANQLKAAELLGMNRNTLRKKIREYGLAPLRIHPPGRD